MLNEQFHSQENDSEKSPQKGQPSQERGLLTGSWGLTKMQQFKRCSLTRACRWTHPPSGRPKRRAPGPLRPCSACSLPSRAHSGLSGFTVTETAFPIISRGRNLTVRAPLPLASLLRFHHSETIHVASPIRGPSFLMLTRLCCVGVLYFLSIHYDPCFFTCVC